MKKLPCVICGVDIKDTFEREEDITEENVNGISFDIGAATKIAYGYGCQLDGNIYLIAICEICTKQKESEGKLIFVRNYIP
jgi:hypothetical protein